MAVHSFVEIANFARQKSKYYEELYKVLPFGETDISKYPVIKQEEFWEANGLENNAVLTDKIENAIVFKSGGTTGNPKYSYFTHDEWEEFTKISGKGFRSNGVKEGDRIANLFYAGELYASFIYITNVIKHAGVGVNYPISGRGAIEESVNLIKMLNINVLAGVPTTIMKIVDYIITNKIQDLKIDLILFGGESFYPDQREALHKAFPDCKINSILYASVDGGELGYFDQTCGMDEHRRFDETTILELVDEDSSEVIEEENRPGKVIITNLCRKLMPIIRYPAGDKAIWTEPKGTVNRKFRLLGRTEEGVRIGPVTLYIQDVIMVLDFYKDEINALNFQIIIEHYDNKDQAIIRLVPMEMPANPDEIANKIINKIYHERHLYLESIESDLIHPLKIEWITNEQLETNARTGKTKRVIDKRFSI